MAIKNYEQIRTFSTVFIFIGALVFTIALFLGFQERIWHAYLLSYFYFVLIALGGVFFVSIQYATNAGWSVSVRRLSEALTAYLPVACVLTLPLIYGAFSLYDWLDAEKIAKDHLLEHKAPYLNLPFFLIRLGIFLGGWVFFARKLVSFSLKQDQDGDTIWTKKGVKYSVIFLLFFALSLSLFSVDLLMSLDAHWFSTIFGVYVFAGLFQSIFAALILLSAWLLKQDKEKYKTWINENHLHDLGKFLFAATIFWAYIAFSQYMLIWYANLPEETTFFIPRSEGVWAFVSISLIVFKFILPFLFLLPRWVKRNWKTMIFASCLILLMQFVDLYWLIYPHFDSGFPYFSWVEVGVFLAFFGFFIRSIFSFLQTHSPVPLKDPRMKESLSHHVTY
jgi:hypothetical protein